MADPCKKAFVDGVLVTLMFGLPVIAAFLYAVIRGIRPESRAEWSYARELGRRAADYMRLGVDPQNAWDRGRKDMNREAQEVIGG